MATSVTLKPNAIDISGSTSGTTTLQASAVAGTTTLTLPAATDTLVGKATTDTLTNKTLTGAVMNGTLGATTPSTASVTTLTTSSTVTHSGGTANGVAYLDGSKVLTTGSALVFDGTNLGLGVTPSAWASGRRSFQVSGSTANYFMGANANGTAFASNFYSDGTNNIYSTNGFANMYLQSSGQHQWYNAASGTAGNPITFTQAMTLDASGNLGIGTTVINGYYGSTSVATRGVYAYTSSSTNCDTAPKGLVIRNDDTTAGNLSQLVFGSLNTGNTPVAAASIWSVNDARSTGFSTGSLAFGTVGGSGVISERARIDSSGNLLVGTTSGSAFGATFRFFVEGSYGAVLKSTGGAVYESLNLWNTATSGTIYQCYFRDGASGSVRGSITTNGSATSYNTSSDYRLKENIQPMAGALAKVAALNPVTYTWKSDGSDGQGFIAHELQSVVPDAVVGAKDAVDADGNPVYQGIDTSFLVATLTAAIKEQQAIIQSLTARITALESA